jgi:hypothetical protein
MNEFLQNLRSGKDRRYERGRRQYINPQYRDNDWRNGNDFNKKPGYRKNPTIENLTVIKQFLENISKEQERFAAAQERVADAVERIAVVLNHLVPSNVALKEAKEICLETNAEPDTIPHPVAEAEKPNHVERNEIIEKILDMRQNGSTYSRIAEHFEANQIPTFSNKGNWCAQTVHRLYKQNVGEKN